MQQKTARVQHKTLRVVNGAWNDGTKADKTVTLSGLEGDALMLGADQIPTAGRKPNDGYETGSWDEAPSATGRSRKIRCISIIM